MSQSANENPKVHKTLVIDGSGAQVFVGLIDVEGKWLARSTEIEIARGAPLERLFPTVDAVLQKAKSELTDISSYLYSEGPGSVLGMRLCAMAIRTWTHLYPESNFLKSYNSLQLTASLALLDNPQTKDALLVSDWKKDTWNSIQISDKKISSVKPVSSETLKEWDGTVWHLPQRKGWQPPPDSAVTLEYTPERIDEIVAQHSLFKETNGVKLYSAGSNVFKKWVPERHRAISN